MITEAHSAAEKIQTIINDYQPKIGMILGSGLSSLCDEMEVLHRIPYANIPGFHQCSIVGHAGELVFARLDGVPVLCMCGRPHYYEGAKPETFKTMLRALKLVGCVTLIITNAAGSLKQSAPPGSVMLIEDHINFQATNPLFAQFNSADAEFGPRFLSMDKVYDAELRSIVTRHAELQAIPLSSGVYVGTQGPVFETPAEIRAYKILGGDAVGMSTIPDAIVAHHCGMRILTLSILTNWGAGMSDTILSHEVTINGAKIGSSHARKLIRASIKDIFQNSIGR
jgi:xanthosine phosphorylase